MASTQTTISWLLCGVQVEDVFRNQPARRRCDLKPRLWLADDTEGWISLPDLHRQSGGIPSQAKEVLQPVEKGDLTE